MSRKSHFWKNGTPYCTAFVKFGKLKLRIYVDLKKIVQLFKFDPDVKISVWSRVCPGICLVVDLKGRVVHYPRKLRNKRKIKGAVCLSTRFWSNLHILTIKMAIFRVFDAARGVLARAPRTRSSWVNGQKSEISKIFKIFEMSILSFNQVILIVFGPKM